MTRFLSILAVVTAAAVAVMAHDGPHESVIPPGYAHEVTDNPPGTGYVASFEANDMWNISGRVFAVSDAMGIGTNFHVVLGGMPDGSGPFNYHIHSDPVPEDKNCSNVGAHFDPYGRGMMPPCAASMPESCEVGDLGGKWGLWLGEAIRESFFDLYVSLLPGSIAFIGNRSIVIHDGDSNRIACATFDPLVLAPTNCQMPVE